MRERADDLLAKGFALDEEQVEDNVESFARLRGSWERIEQMPPRVAPASRAVSSVDVGDRVVAGVCVDGEVAFGPPSNLLGVSPLREELKT